MAETSPLIPISASRLKVCKDCSWLYWSKYHLKLPDTTNKGALSGTCCHTVFECLLNPRHREKHAAILTVPATIKNCPAIDRYVRTYCQKYKLDNDSYKLIDAMIVVGLAYDFYCEKGNAGNLMPERKFDITNQEPRYRIMGFIDKTAEYQQKGLLRIVDYKSSKRQFEGKDLDSNVQAMMYSLAARTFAPDLQPIVEFIFLQFPASPVQRLKFSEATLTGFEHYLADVSKKLSKFGLKEAMSDYAADKDMPDEGFSGPLMCGRAKEKGEMKKDGTPKYACQYKFPFRYFSLCREDGTAISSAFSEDDLKPDEAKGEFVVALNYLGCPRWNKGVTAKLRG